MLLRFFGACVIMVTCVVCAEGDSLAPEESLAMRVVGDEVRRFECGDCKAV